MPKKTLPRIAAVVVDKKPLTLRIRWDKGDESEVDVSGLIETFRVYEPLRRSPQLLRKCASASTARTLSGLTTSTCRRIRSGDLRKSRAARPCRRMLSDIGANARP